MSLCRQLRFTQVFVDLLMYRLQEATENTSIAVADRDVKKTMIRFERTFYGFVDLQQANLVAILCQYESTLWAAKRSYQSGFCQSLEHLRQVCFRRIQRVASLIVTPSVVGVIQMALISGGTLL